MKKYVWLVLSLVLVACGLPQKVKASYKFQVDQGPNLSFTSLKAYKGDEKAQLRKIHQASDEEIKEVLKVLSQHKLGQKGEALASAPSEDSLVLSFEGSKGETLLYLYDEEDLGGTYYYTLNGNKDFYVLKSKKNLIPPLKEALGIQETITTPFKDIHGHWAQRAMAKAYQTKDLKGVDESHFKPDLPLSRAMLVQALYQKNKPQDAFQGPLPFKDLPRDAWYKDALAWAYKEGIVKGSEAGTFKPEDPVSRQDFALILYRYTDYLGNLHQDKSVKPYKDHKQIALYAKKAVETMTLEGYIKGDPDGNFRPKDPLTRAELAQVFLKKSL